MKKNIKNSYKRYACRSTLIYDCIIIAKSYKELIRKITTLTKPEYEYRDIKIRFFNNAIKVNAVRSLKKDHYHDDLSWRIYHTGFKYYRDDRLRINWTIYLSEKQFPYTNEIDSASFYRKSYENLQ